MPDRNPLIRAVTSANGFTVREAIPSDADAIAGFNVAMALETEQRELDAETVRAGVQAVFDEPSRGTYVIAETRNGPDSPDNEVIGGLLITHEWSDWRNGDIWWIQSVHVDPAHRRKGVYRAMYAGIMYAARVAKNVAGIRLYVDRDNETGHTVYESLGMHQAHYNIYEVNFVLGA